VDAAPEARVGVIVERCPAGSCNTFGTTNFLDEVDPDPRHNLRVALPDGRRLGYAEWGTEDGPTVFDFHGGPGSRLCPSGLPSTLEGLGLRWISVERPGIGLSDPHPNRCVADWPLDVAELADQLGIDEFGVIGWSMGGPYAAATAAVLGDRVTAAGLLAPSTFSPGLSETIEGKGKTGAWELARDDPWTAVTLYTALGLEFRRDPDAASAMLAAGCSEPELEVFALPEVHDLVVQMMLEANRQGAFGFVEDQRVDINPWGFDVTAITASVHVWEGTEDSFSTAGVAQGWVDAVPNGTLHTLPGEGHPFPFTHTQQIAATLFKH
jgi:pimeloyl-ACP methyl ester carboxylesterase